MLRDPLMVGINDEHIQAKLLAVETKAGEIVSCKKVYELAVAVEATQKDVSDMKGSAVLTTNVHTLKQETHCWRCGASHNQANCSTNTTKCFNCQQSGHVAARCHTARNQERLCTPRSERGRDPTTSNNHTKSSTYNTHQEKLQNTRGRTRRKGKDT